MDFSKAREIVKKCTLLIGISGKKITKIDLKSGFPSDGELEKIIIVRSGTLRAPCIKIGNVFVAGYNAEVYKSLL